ncbi:transcriptional regulator NrdR [Candidatus Micrarchaeota archaeon CG08_land_8_20_14_0_20_59_11]|nr:MAG: transcriptional regulator NrdR [Candidatus Micrarchaeota archaeon CG08_land_8_20_14_0_20_59_11]
MRCPYCNHEETKVLDSREAEDKTRRRRECEKCEKRFTTYERVEIVELIVVKKDGSREQFDRNKLKRGILQACWKRPVTAEQIDNLVDEVERELRMRETTEVQSKEVGELAMKKLKTLDKVAYIRFASVYRDFEDIEEFEEELKALLRKKR